MQKYKISLNISVETEIMDKTIFNPFNKCMGRFCC